MIAMDAVISSNIKAIGFAGETLAVQFKNGGVYHYTGESAAAHYAAMKDAPSKGVYYAQHVRKDKTLVAEKQTPAVAAAPETQP